MKRSSHIRSPRGFTLVEILVVVIIVGLLSGLAVLKLADAKERSEENYMKSTASFMDRKVQEIVVKEGAFPAIPDGTPEERVSFILGELDSRNMMVYAEDLLNKQDLLTLKLQIASLEESDRKVQILAAFSKTRGDVPSGDPSAHELLVLPQGVIIYPEEPKLVINNPEEPNYEYHFDGYWKPIEIDAGVQNLLNGGFTTQKERDLVMNNLGLADVDVNTFKALLASTNNSEEHNQVAGQLVDIIEGRVTSDTLTPEAAAELLNGMLANVKYNPASLDISGVDLSLIGTENYAKIAENTSIDAAQVQYLIDNAGESSVTQRDIMGKLLLNPNLDSDSAVAVMDKIGSSLNYLDQYTYWNLLKNANIDSTLKSDLMSDYFAVQLDTFKDTHTTASAAANSAFTNLISYASSAGGLATLSMSEKQSLAVAGLTVIPNATNNGTFNNLIRNGTIVPNAEMLALALPKLLSSLAASNNGSTFTEVIAQSGFLMTEAEKQQVRNAIGTNPYSSSYNAILYANADIYNTPESLAWAVTNATIYGYAGNGISGKYAMLNPNLSAAQADTLINGAINGGQTVLRSYLGNKDVSDALTAKISDARKLEIYNSVTNNLSSANSTIAANIKWDAATTENLVDIARLNPTSTLGNNLLNYLHVNGAQLAEMISGSSSPYTQLMTALHPTSSRSYLTTDELTTLITSVVENPNVNVNTMAQTTQAAVRTPELYTQLANAFATKSNALDAYNIAPSLLSAMSADNKAILEAAFVSGNFTSTGMTQNMDILTESTKALYVEKLVTDLNAGGGLSYDNVFSTMTQGQATELYTTAANSFNTVNNTYSGETRYENGAAIEERLYVYQEATKALSAKGKLTAQQAADFIQVGTNSNNYVDGSYLWSGNAIYESSQVAYSTANKLIASGESIQPIVDALATARIQAINEAEYTGNYPYMDYAYDSGSLAIHIGLIKAGALDVSEVDMYGAASTPDYYNGLSLEDKLWLNSNILNQ